MLRAALILALVVFATASAPAPTTEPTLAVIVHRDRVDELGVQDVANMFLKRRRFCADGAPIVALNREPRTTARESFSRRVLGATSETFAAYWNEQYFHGIFPPITLSSSAAVKRYVATDRNAIGYIEIGEVDASVRVVLRLE